MLSECSSFILAPSVFLVACSDSICHYVGPSVGLLVGNAFTFKPFWPFVMSSIKLFGSEKSFWRSLKPNFPEITKNQKIFKSSKGQKYAILGPRTSLKFLSMLSPCWSFILGNFRNFSCVQRLHMSLCQFVNWSVGR